MKNKFSVQINALSTTRFEEIKLFTDKESLAAKKLKVQAKSDTQSWQIPKK